MDNIRKFIGDKVRSFRNERGWSQEELAYKIGVHASYIGQLERGEKNVTIDSLEKIVNALNISFEALFNTENSSVALSDMLNKLNCRSIEDQKIIIRFINELMEWKDS